MVHGEPPVFYSTTNSITRSHDILHDVTPSRPIRRRETQETRKERGDIYIHTSVIRSPWNLIILVSENHDYRVSRANQGCTCHSFDPYLDNRHILLFAFRCNRVHSRRMNVPVHRPIVRLGVNDRIAIIRAWLITRVAVIYASFPSSFALFSLVPLLTRSVPACSLSRYIIAFITSTSRNCGAPVVLKHSLVAHRGHRDYFKAIVERYVSSISSTVSRFVAIHWPVDVFCDFLATRQRNISREENTGALSPLEKKAISCEPITKEESVPVSRAARRSNIWGPFFFPSVLLFPTYARIHPTSYYRG